MRRQPLFWFLVSLLCLGGALFFWRLGDQWEAEKAAAHSPAAQSVSPAPVPHALAPGVKKSSPLAAASPIPADPKFPFRLRNTTESISNLVHNQKAILLANAFIDTGKPMNLAIPESLRAPANNGTYIVQSRGPLSDQFRASLNDAGASIISYIPNNAYLVRVSNDGAQQLSSNPQTQSVLPYEPYYKIMDSAVLKQVIDDPNARAPGAGLNIVLFGDAYQSTVQALANMNVEVVAEESSPFGQVITVHPQPGTVAAIASLPGVQVVSAAHARKLANDMVRPRLDVAADSITSTNYLGLTGSNVLVNINDSGVDSKHPDFNGRITGDGVDNNGHGTHVAGTILGNGSMSSTVTDAIGSVSNANFRGLATNATAFVMQFDAFSDADLQQQAAATNALISNNSWNYVTAAGYDIAAASYDAAVRDALPGVTGSQPLVFVFSAGGDGGGDGNGGGQSADTILSPGTAKNVITVGAIEQPRFIIVTNDTVTTDGSGNTTTNSVTNTLFFSATDSSNQVAAGSSCGNVGVNIEGPNGRFKPDLVSPGTFVISTRSETWDTNAYYNPTNDTDSPFPNEVVVTNSLDGFPPVFLPGNVVGLSITISTNRLSPDPFPYALLPIYVGVNTNPTVKAHAFVGTGPTLTVPTGLLTPGNSIYFSVGNTTTQSVAFNAVITMLTTNDDGYFTSLESLNAGVGPWYRYESGTSMAAAGVSGMLALLEEFFQKLNMTPSPALLKAMLINGARPLPAYDLQVATALNAEGWGLPDLINTIPPALSNLTSANFAATLGTMPVQFFDQSPTNVLATGQSYTRKVSLTGNAQGQDLRLTLVWTDPPGNPVAGVKLVNDLDLIVTNLDTGEVFYGNDIPAGSDFNESTDTNGVPIVDSVNNVENVFLEAPLGTNYSVTVLGRRVNVNAVTANTNGIVQDYALVISSGDQGQVSSPFTITNLNNGAISSNSPLVTNLTVVSNGIPLFNQRVGANSQYSGSTNGTAAQWNFYVFTNSAAMTNASFTNVAILTFVPPDISLPRMSAFEEVAPPDTNATRYAGADIDLYVSTNPGLTNLDTNVINAIPDSMKSTTRTGTEKVLITNSAPGTVYYIGVKSEDQEGAQFSLFSVATSKPFDLTDANGNVQITILTPFPVPIPPGGPQNPNHGLILGVSTSPIVIRKAVVTNTVQHQEFGDLIGTLTHAQKTAVLNNHSFFTNLNDTAETLVYDDSGENDIPGTRKSDGPGTLQNFTGDSASAGVWMFTMVNDSSLTDTGQINNFVVFLEPQSGTNTIHTTVQTNSYFFDFVDVPADATNLTISVSGNTALVDLLIREGNFPSLTTFDNFAALPPGGGSLSISKYSSPPLNGGRYFYAIYNPSTTPQNVTITIEVDQSLTPVASDKFLSVGNEALPDDAVMYSTNHVGADSTVVSAEVGVRIIHPRESDLTLTLISPTGTRVLLAENRGGLDTNGYGSGMNITNALPPLDSGGVNADTNIISTTTNFGTLIVNYQFFTEPDQMRIYYDGVLLYDTGLIPGNGTISVNFGPGSATNIVITMNEFGNPDATTLWNYQASVVTEDTTYAIFSENTNLATVPIKFATPPFGAGAPFIPPLTNFVSSFENIAATNYTSASGLVDGWSVLDTNPVQIVTVPALAVDGSNVLALHGGGITRTVSNLVAGNNYTLSFAYHGRPSVNPVGWWKGENDLSDSSANNNGANLKPGGTVGFGPGVVGNGFDFTGSGLEVTDQAYYKLTNFLSIEGWIDGSSPDGIGQMIFWRGDSRPGYDSYLVVDNPPNNVSGAPRELDFNITGESGAGAFVSAPLQLNVLTYFAATYSYSTNTASGLLSLYMNGALIAQTNTTLQPIADLVPAYGPAVGIGDLVDQFGFTIPFIGLIDEITLYSNALSDVQVQDIYAAGSAGKDPVGGSPPVTATVNLSGQASTISGVDRWITNFIPFTATSNTMTLTITPDLNNDGFGNLVHDGMLLDSFKLIQNASPNPTNYYLPEESLDKLIGEPSQGDWLLEVLDNRAGATNVSGSAATPTLVSWQLSLELADKQPAAIPVNDAQMQSNTVPPNSIVYYVVNVPPWAKFATNTLTSVNGGSLNLLFNQSILPSTNITDYLLLNNVTTVGTSVLNTTNTSPILVPGQRYYLGVQNLNTNTPAKFTLQVNFDITPLTNAVPLTSTIALGSIPRYFSFDVDSNAVETLFQIVNTSGNIEMVIHDGPPLPDTVNFDFLSFGALSQIIAVPTNAYPVPPLLLPPLGTNRWYIGVFNNDITNVTYTIMATEAGQPTIITLTNGVPYNFTNTPPGPALTNFYVFSITNNPAAVLYELYNLTGDVDLTTDPGALPYAAPFFASSASSGTNIEQIVIRTNGIATQIIPSLNTNWYLGVPNNASSNVTYTIRATLSTNGLLIGSRPIQVVPTLPVSGGSTGPTLTWASVYGEYYEIQYSSDLINWFTLATIPATGSTLSFTDPSPISGNRFYRVIQVPAP